MLQQTIVEMVWLYNEILYWPIDSFTFLFFSVFFLKYIIFLFFCKEKSWMVLSCIYNFWTDIWLICQVHVLCLAHLYSAQSWLFRPVFFCPMLSVVTCYCFKQHFVLHYSVKLGNTCQECSLNELCHSSL